MNCAHNIAVEIWPFGKQRKKQEDTINMDLALRK
jgi:hypothetical protein